MDLGQGRELEAVRDRALAPGAARAHVLDLREEFARDYVLPACSRPTRSTKIAPRCESALGRPLIARKLVEIAAIEHATAVAHGCDGRRQDGALSPLDAHRFGAVVPDAAASWRWHAGETASTPVVECEPVGPLDRVAGHSTIRGPSRPRRSTR